ncbi:MAG TPA: oligosaccharide flippase family protein [Gemmatimonadaceae bacterium]|nr:oligosaccharide flippase family protein [Gemmatimonadaceae bacterium]
MTVPDTDSPPGADANTRGAAPARSPSPGSFGVGELVRRARELLAHEGTTGRLARGALQIFAVNAGGTLVAFVVQILLARTLGPADYGLYAYALGLMNIVLLVAKFDFENAALRFVGAYRGRREWGLLRGFLRYGHEVVVLSSLVVAAIAALIVLSTDRLTPGESNTYLIACALLPVTAILTFKSSALQGLTRVVEAQAPGMLIRPLLFGLGVAALALGAGMRMTAALAVAANLVASILVLVLSTVFLRRGLPTDAKHAEPVYAAREWWHVALGLLLISASQVVLSQQADVVVVGSIVDKVAAGHYNAASQLATLVNFGVTAVLFITAPMISELHARGGHQELQRLVTMATRANLLASVPVFFALLLAGGLALGLYGPTFRDAYPVLVILGVSQLAVALVGSLSGFLMSMTGNQNAAAVVIGGSAALNIVLTVILTPIFGLIGTATATLIGTLTRSVLLTLLVRRRLAVRLTLLAS